MLIDDITIAGACDESGARDLANYAKKAMSEDFCDKVKPYLLSF